MVHPPQILGEREQNRNWQPRAKNWQPEAPGNGLTSINSVDLIHECGEPAGTRTQDHLIKSQVLYHLSYGLLRRVCRGAPPGGQ